VETLRPASKSAGDASGTSPLPTRQQGAADAITAMLEARSVALVGASPRPGSLGERMVAEVARSLSRPRVHLVNPRYDEIGSARCHPSVADLPGPVDLVLLAVPDAALDDQLTAAASRGARSAVIFGGAHDVPGQPPGLRARLAATARDAGMALCGAGCMGFVNVTRGLRAVGYVEPDPLPAGPVALVTHSGSVFSAMLRNRRAIGFTIAVSSGQELVTTAADYLRYALSLPQTRVLALVLEAIRDAGPLRSALAAAAAADVPVVLLAAGGSDRGRALVSAHSGALAVGDGAWEALADAYGVHRASDLAEMADTLELFAIARRPAAGAQRPRAQGSRAQHPRAQHPRGQGSRGRGSRAQRSGAPPPGAGIATVHDSGLERAHVADLAERLGVPFAAVGSGTLGRLAALLDRGLEPANPLDMWGTGRDAEQQLEASLTAMAEDPSVAAVALAVDLVPEFDGDESYQHAVLTAAQRSTVPVVVLAGLPASIDPVAAARLRAAGVPVLEGTRTGLLALRHLLDHAGRAAPCPRPAHPVYDSERRKRHTGALAAGRIGAADMAGLLREYEIPAARTIAVTSREAAMSAAAEIGYPVVLKTDEPAIAHKSDVGGVLTGLDGPAAVAAGYDDLAERLGPRAVVCQTAAAGTEIVLGIATDPALGPLIVAGAGGVLTELLADRAVALPPVDRDGALRMLRRLRVASVLAGARGRPPADLTAVAGAIAALSTLACELGGALDALDINPLICSPSGVLAVDALAIPRRPAPDASAQAS
jgi:acyl-CoA synthetase (NDP forming)